MVRSREIIDESDVYVDVHRAVRRKTPAPETRIARFHATTKVDGEDKPKGDVLVVLGDDDQLKPSEPTDDSAKEHDETPKPDSAADSKSEEASKAHLRTMRSLNESSFRRGSVGDLRNHTKHLGPSNLASRPRHTRYNSVIIKHAGGTSLEDSRLHRQPSERSVDSRTESATIKPEGNRMKDGVRAVHAPHGSTGQYSTSQGMETSDQSVQANSKSSLPQDSAEANDNQAGQQDGLWKGSQSRGDGDLDSTSNPSQPRLVTTAPIVVKSGSITESIIEAGGIKKVVLEPASSSEEGDTGSKSQAEGEDRPRQETK